MGFQLENWQEEALALNAKERNVRQELEQMVTEILPVGVGALSWITLQLEIRGWGSDSKWTKNNVKPVRSLAVSAGEGLCDEIPLRR